MFTVLHSLDMEENRAQVEAYRRLAREEYGRELKVWSLAYIVQRPTEAEAHAFYHHYVNELGDWDAAENVIATMGLNAKSIPPEHMQAMKERFIAGWSGYPLIGTPERVVDGLRALSGIGLDGVLLSWPCYEAEMTAFRDITYPMVKQAGLR